MLFYGDGFVLFFANCFLLIITVPSATYQMKTRLRNNFIPNLILDIFGNGKLPKNPSLEIIYFTYVFDNFFVCYVFSCKLYCLFSKLRLIPVCEFRLSQRLFVEAIEFPSKRSKESAGTLNGLSCSLVFA